MTASIVLTGLSANDPVPGNYLEINFAQGPSAGSGSQRTALFIGNRTTAGVATVGTVVYGPDTPVPAQTESDWINLTGSGSPLHRMFRRWTAINKTTSLYFICVAESGGTAASLTVTIASSATGNGNLRLWVGDEFVDTGITSGDSVTTIAAAAVVNINARTHWPVTAANSAGVITLTAKVKGPRGNFIRVQTLITSGITTTATRGTDTPLASGATADDNTTVLATILSSKYYYIVSEAEDATQLNAVVSQVGTQALPTSGIRQRVFGGSVDTLSNVNTIATGNNAARAEIEWSKNSDWTPAELAANNAAIYALLENSGSKPRNNYSSFPTSTSDQALWKVPAPRDQTAWPTRADIKSALNNGVTPIGVQATGATYLVKRVTTKSLTSSVADYRIRDAHKVTILDFYGDDLLAKLALQFGGKDLADDPAQGSPPPDKSVATPGAIKGAVNRLTTDYGESSLFQRTAEIIAGTIVQRETNPTTRVSIRIPAQPVDILDSTAVALDQVA